VIFEVFTAMKIQVLVFWITPKPTPASMLPSSVIMTYFTKTTVTIYWQKRCVLPY